jgi:hypothetical protein
MRARDFIREFDPGPGGFGPFRLYMSMDPYSKRHLIGQFGTQEEAEQELQVQMSINADKGHEFYYYIVDGQDQEVGGWNPADEYDAQRQARKVQYRNPGSIEEVSRRGFLQGAAGAAALATAPGQSLAKIMIPQTSGTQSYVWQKIGDALDREHLTSIVDRIVELYPRIGTQELDANIIRQRLDQVLRRHIPTLSRYTQNKDWSSVQDQFKRSWQDLQRQLPARKRPDDWPEDADEDDYDWRDYDQWEQEDRLHDDWNDQFRNLIKITRDANLGDTESYGYKVLAKQARMKGKRSPTQAAANIATDTASDVAQKAVKTAAGSVARGQALAAGGGGLAALKQLVKKVMGRSTGTPAQSPPDQARSTPATPALPAPDQSAAEIMRDLQDIVGRDLTDREKVAVKQEMDKNK